MTASTNLAKKSDNISKSGGVLEKQLSAKGANKVTFVDIAEVIVSGTSAASPQGSGKSGPKGNINTFCGLTSGSITNSSGGAKDKPPLIMSSTSSGQGGAGGKSSTKMAMDHQVSPLLGCPT